MQGQVRKKENQCTGSIWDCLPITEKAKDEINFAGLNEEVCGDFEIFTVKMIVRFVG